MATTTFFALLAARSHAVAFANIAREGGPEVVTFEAEGTARNVVDPALVEQADHAGLCWYVDLTVPECPSWTLSTPDAEGHVEHESVPEAVRDAGALWWAPWAGRDCARAWHEEAPSAIEIGTQYRDWAARQELPAEGDVDFLEGGIKALTGREPTEAERKAFRSALLEKLFDLSPVEEAA